MEVLMKEFKDSHFAVIKATELCYEFKKHLHIGNVIASRTWHRMVSKILDDLDTPKELRPSKDYIGNESVSGPEIVADHLMTLGLLGQDNRVRPTYFALDKCMPKEETLGDPTNEYETIDFLDDISKEYLLRENSTSPEFAMYQVRLGRAALLPGGILEITNYGRHYRNYLNSK
jgi:hypothetical protein